MENFISKRSELCSTCKIGNYARLVRDIAVNGAVNVYWLCTTCSKPFYIGKKFIKHEKLIGFVDIEMLPVIDDFSAQGEPCAVCGRRNTELHHWAPKHLFGEDADKWPTSHLCNIHHPLWHSIVTPNMYKKSR